MPDEKTEALGGLPDIPTDVLVQGFVGLLERVLDGSVPADKADQVRKALEKTLDKVAPAGQAAGGVSPSADALTSESKPDRLTSFMWFVGILFGAIITIFVGFAIFAFNTLSNNLGDKIAGLESKVDIRMSGMETKISGIEARITGLENKLEAKIDSLSKTVTDLRGDVGKLQGIVSGQPYTLSDRQRPLPNDDSSSDGHPGQDLPMTAEGVEPRLD
jgi:hypothetical protein